MRQESEAAREEVDGDRVAIVEDVVRDTRKTVDDGIVTKKDEEGPVELAETAGLVLRMPLDELTAIED